MDTEILEAQILYSTIFTPKWTDILFTLSDIDFSHFQDVFKAIKKLKDEDKYIDYTAVLSLTKQAKEVCLTALSEDNMGMTIIPDKKIFEERVNSLKEISVKIQIHNSQINELDIDVLRERLEQIYKKGNSRWLSGEDIRALAFKLQKDKKATSTTYGLSLLDKATGGLQKGQYIIVAGRPSIGKSSFLQYIGLKNAEKGKKVLFVSIEMSEEMIIKRILMTYPPNIIPESFNILITGDMQTIESEIQKKATDFDMVLVDYIQLLQPKIKTRDMYERVTNISSDIKKMATKFNIPFVCASQFSRKAEGNQPNLADLKESGALEQDADVVVSLWKNKGDDEFGLDYKLSTIRIDLLKNRNGWTFSNNDIKTYSVMFKKDEFRFYDTEERKEDEQT